MLDTGSNTTLIKLATVQRLGLKVNKSKCLPNLTAANAQPIKTLGMVPLEIHVGDQEIFKRWCPVIPNHFLAKDLLLGCDVIRRSSVTWNPKEEILVWGKTEYHVNRIQINPKNVKHVTVERPLKVQSSSWTGIPCRELVKIAPFKSQVSLLKVKENPGESLLIYPCENFSSQVDPLLVTVNKSQQVPVLINNPSKVYRILKAGTVVANYEIYNGPIEPPESRVNAAQIENNLEPANDVVIETGSRVERLQHLLNEQSWSHLDASQRSALSEIILKHENLFMLDKSELGTIQGDPAHIRISDPNPSKSPIYRYPEHAKVIISEMLTDMENRGVIEPSTAAWLSPIVLVNKPDGSKRMCLDFRRVNEHLSDDIYPLPRLDDLVNLASGHQYYATLDLKDAYFQIVLDNESRDLTTFSDGISLYRFRRLPFGLSCAPAIFSRKMAEILAELTKEGWVRNYLDDIILWADDFSQLLTRLTRLFTVLARWGVKLNLSKCDLGKQLVKFLGHKVSVKGSVPDGRNIEAILKQEPPRTQKAVRSFLGMCGFYRKFVPNFASIAMPLTNLTRNDVSFEWSSACQEAFELLKKKLTTPPVLVNYMPYQPHVLVTDASKEYVGAVLHQIQPDSSVRPLGYFSKKLNKAEGKYHITDQEALAVVLACRNFHHYLWGTKFTIQTDHQPLTTIFRKRTKSPRVTRWMLEMREYNFKIKYIKGKHNVVADHLSRPVNFVNACSDNTWLGLSKEEFVKEQEEDHVWGDLRAYLEGGPLSRGNLPNHLESFEIYDGILYFVKETRDGTFNYNLVVPESLVNKALEVSHDLQGHFGQHKTIYQAMNKFYFPNLKSRVSRYIRNCISCQKFKPGIALQHPYKSFPVVTKPLERVAIDLTDLHSGKDGYRYVLTLIDHYSRFVRFFPLKGKHASGIVDCLKDFCWNYGKPAAIILDNAKEFTGQEMKEWTTEEGIELLFVTPYHPQANGMCERVHRTLKTVLAQLCQGYPARWPRYLLQCQFLLNSAVHTATTVTPFEAMFGRPPLRKVGVPLPSVPSDDSSAEMLKEIVIKAGKEAQKRSLDYANRKVRPRQVKLGDLVWVKVEKTMAHTSCKLNPKWMGPYKVCEILQEGLAYVMKDPFSERRVQRAAHKVKPYISDEMWVCEPQVLGGDSEVEDVDEPLPPRLRRAPRRLIEET